MTTIMYVVKIKNSTTSLVCLTLIFYLFLQCYVKYDGFTTETTPEYKAVQKIYRAVIFFT